MLLVDCRSAAALLGPVVEGRSREIVAVAHLGAQRRLLGVTERKGAAAVVDMPLRHILAEGVRLGARAMIVAHNHPSGDSAPSVADLVATRRLAELGEALGIRLLDHLIFGGEDCTSMRALGLL